MPIRDAPGLCSSSEAGDASLYTSIVQEKCNASLRCNLKVSSSHIKNLNRKNLKYIEPNVPKLSLQYIINVKKLIFYILFFVLSLQPIVFYTPSTSLFELVNFNCSTASILDNASLDLSFLRVYRLTSR